MTGPDGMEPDDDAWADNDANGDGRQDVTGEDADGAAPAGLALVGDALGPAGPRVRILDLSGGAEDGITEEVSGFGSVEHANAFARAYVRDSVEVCRPGGSTGRDALDAWFAFGEDAEVIGAGDDAWRSAGELSEFAANPARAAERDWRSLDPRRGDGEDDDEA